MHVYGTCLFLCLLYECVGVCGNVYCVSTIVKDSVYSLGVLKYVVCLCKGCDGCFLFVL